MRQSSSDWDANSDLLLRMWRGSLPSIATAAGISTGVEGPAQKYGLVVDSFIAVTALFDNELGLDLVWQRQILPASSPLQHLLQVMYGK